jgi:hypothetical protein
MDRLDPSNAEDAENIHKMILSEDVSDNGSIDDGTESDEDYVELREGDSESAEDATLDDDCCNKVYTAEILFHWKGQDEVGQGKKFYTHSTEKAKYCNKITWGYWPSKECHYAT